MTKKEMFQELDALQEEKHVKIDGIHSNSNKAEIQNAIDCLKCSDDMLEKYFVVFSLKYSNTAETIKSVGDFKIHRFNRLYVYNTARNILAD